MCNGWYASQDDFVQKSTRSGAGTALVSIINVIVRQNSSVAFAAACLSLDDMGSRTPLYYRLQALSMSARFALGERSLLPAERQLSFSAHHGATRCFCAHSSPDPLRPDTAVAPSIAPTFTSNGAHAREEEWTWTESLRPTPGA